MCDLGNREISEFVSHPLVAEIPNVSRFKAHGAGGEGAGIRVSKGEALGGARSLVDRRFPLVIKHSY